MPDCAVVFIIIGARSASWMILERFQEAHPGKQHREQRRSKKTAAKLATSRVFMSSSWLWQPFGSCFCSIMVPTSQYCLPLTSGLENSVEQPYSWKRLRIRAWRHWGWPHCIGDPLYWDWDPATPGHRDRATGTTHRHIKSRDRDRDRATGPPTPDHGQDRRQGLGPGPGPGQGHRATAKKGSSGTGHRDRATGTGPAGPAPRTRQK